MRTYLLPGLALLAVAIVGCTLQSRSEDSSLPPAVDVAVAGTFDWSVPERFGLDDDGDGRLDVPNTLEYVLNLGAGDCSGGCAGVIPVFNVVLDATEVKLVDSSSRIVPIEKYEWTFAGEEEVKLDAGESSQAVVSLPEGRFEVTLEIRGGGQLRTLDGVIEVSDILIVSIGDSFASGEGNPDTPGDPALWADDGMAAGSLQELAHDLAHRSTLAGPVQAALEIERSDPHTSVTFVFLAASGASLEEGIMGAGREAVASDGQRRSLRPQLDQLSELAGCTEQGCQRTVDSLLISAGGNDIGFSFTLGSLILLDPALVVNPIYGNLLNNLVSDVESEISDLPSAFTDLVAAVERLDPAAVYLTAYPDPSRVSGGGRLLACESIGGDLVPGLEIDRDELEIVRERILKPLNDTLESIADAEDWVFVDAHIETFAGHGYCGTDPYGEGSYTGSPYPDPVVLSSDQDSRWFRQADESVSIQGGGGAFRPDRLGTTGTFHPNEFGHQAYKQALLEALNSGR